MLEHTKRTWNIGVREGERVAYPWKLREWRDMLGLMCYGGVGSFGVGLTSWPLAVRLSFCRRITWAPGGPVESRYWGNFTVVMTLFCSIYFRADIPIPYFSLDTGV